VNITNNCFDHNLTRVMLSCLSKLFNTTLVTVVVSSKMITNLNLVVNIVDFF
jgi:hypothetical protein